MKRLKTFLQLENNQLAPQCLAKRKKHRRSYLSLTLKVLDTLNRPKLEYLKSQK